ncbi:hypothetical protein L3V77_14875 [Vibrio sp. DW001]|uniref:hypothetical protein n=1 Tax=Vibrio sp. DW001 TaxID=2912315 RepID=UPI0023AFB95D|nr:hypothetical protein [Vibrio sp. DW001]WED26275.1 hypothetical protein L3V77_14875 [Vibrio sp. DW001]
MNERMTMLLGANVISQYAHDATLQAVNILVKEWDVDTSSEQIQMAMTHFARAVDRIRSEDAISAGLDADILDEILTDEKYPIIVEMNNQLCHAAGLSHVPESENSFFLSNLYSILLN